MLDRPNWTPGDWLTAAQLRAAALTHQTLKDRHLTPPRLAHVLDAYRHALGPDHPAAIHLQAAITHLRKETRP